MSGKSNGRASNPPASFFTSLAPVKRNIVNADEAVIGVIPVPFVEWEEGTPQQVGSRTIVPRTPIQRLAQIHDFVPAMVYDAFLFRLDDLQAIVPAMVAANQVEKGASEEEKLAQALQTMEKEKLRSFLDLAYECVLVVWQNSEEDMELTRLKRGLKEEHVTALFTHFFSLFSRQQQASAEADGNISNG